MIRDLLDDEGENRAVRSFLMQYSCDRAITVGAMLAHMNRSDWRGTAPAFALEVRPETHLTKAGVQLWIRHLFSLESPAPTAGEASARTDEQCLPPFAEPAGRHDAAAEIVNWLRRQANAEKDPVKRAIFIESHNAALAIKATQGGKEGA